MLTVEPCPPAEGRQGQPSRVLLNPRDMAALGVSMGEPVLLHTSSTLDTHGIGSEAWQAFQQALAQHRPALAIGTAWPAAHASEHSALLSAMLRSNAGAALGDKIQVWPIEHAQRAGQLRVLPAASCTLAVRSTPAAGAARTAVPLPAGGTLRTYLRSRLQGQYVVPGNEIVVSLLGEKRVLCITALRSEVSPVSIGEEQAAVYLIGSGTDVEISEAVDTGAQPPKQAWAAALAPSTTKADSSPEPQAEPEPEPELALGQTRGVAGEGAYPPPAVGGLEAQLASVRELLGVALHTPDRMEQLGLRPPSGVLLYGPPGTGKTLIARSLAAECGDEVAFVSIDGAEIVGKYVGESEARLREVFEAAAHAPCGKTLIFIDEIDALAPSREKGGGAGQSELHNRIVATFLTLLDGVKPSEAELGGPSAESSSGSIGGRSPPGAGGGKIFVIAATNRPDALDEALRRPGRLDREIEVGVPTLDMRKQILEAVLRSVPHTISQTAVAKLAADSHGFTGADLSLLVKEATLLAVRRLLRAKDSSSRKTKLRQQQSDDSSGPGGLADQVDALVAFYGQHAVGGAKTAEQCRSILLKRIRNQEQTQLGLPQLEWLELCEKLGAKYPAAAAPTAFQHATAAANMDAGADVGGGEAGTDLVVREADALAAIGVVRPSCMREVALEIPSVLWSDIGGGADLQQQLREAVEWPLSHPEAFIRMGIRPPRGVLLYGPPGCSKTLTARALATESKLNFIAVKGPELFSKWVGESEKAVRDIYRKARAAAPAIVFFDEIDALAAQRGASGSASVGDRVLSQLLTELDGVVGSAGAGGELASAVVTIAATNRPDLLDAALLRPGRFDRQVYVGPPDFDARRDILKIGLRGIPTAAPGTPGGGGGVGGGLNFDALAMRSEGFSGAEMSALCREAAMSALSKAVAAAEAEAEVEVGKNPEATAAAAAGGGGGGQVDEEMGGAVARAEGLRVGPENFDDAFKVVKASITAEQKEFYRKYAAARRSN